MTDGKRIVAVACVLFVAGCSGGSASVGPQGPPGPQGPQGAPGDTVLWTGSAVRDVNAGAAGLTVTLEPGHLQAQTDADGGFALTAAAGAYQATIDASGFHLDLGTVHLVPGETRRRTVVTCSSRPG